MSQNETKPLQQKRESRKKAGPGTISVWILIGLLLGMVAIQFRLAGHWNLDRFYDVGNKYTITYESYTMSYDGLEYQSDGMYHLTSDSPAFPIRMDKQADQVWKYFYIKVENISSDSLKMNLALTNTQGSVVEQKTVELKDGLNRISLSGIPANSATLTFPDQKGTTFWISFMQIRENPSYFTVPKVAAMLGLFLLFYFPITWLLYRFLLSKLALDRLAYFVTDALATVYRTCLFLLEKLMFPIPDLAVSVIRRILFTAMIVLMLYTEDYGYYNNWDYYKIYLAVNGLLLLLISFVSFRQAKRKVSWRNPLIFAWIIYSVLACISDLLVPKTQMFTGVFMFVVMGVLFYTIARLKSPIQILRDFSFASLLVYWVGAVFCLICRPVTGMAEGRYVGFTIAPASYALFLGVVIAIFFSEIDRCITLRKSIAQLVFHLVGLVSSMYFMWITQSRDGVLALGACGLVFLFRVWFMRKEKGYLKRWFLAAVLLVIVTVPVVWGQDWALHNLPDKLGTTVYFDKDVWMINKPQEPDQQSKAEALQEIFDPLSGTQVWASDGANKDHLFKKSLNLDILSSGRLTIYKEYIANMNLWGHAGDPNIGVGRMRAHNAILQTGYRYGVLAVVPYIIMILLTILYAGSYARKNWRKIENLPILPIGMMLSVFVMMMLDNVERNFRYLPWIAFYLLIGLLSNVESE